MTPIQALLEARKYGASVSVRGDKLHVEADEPLPPEVMDGLRTHKAALLDMLLQPPDPDPQPVCCACRLPLDMDDMGARQWRMHPNCERRDWQAYWAERQRQEWADQ